jgi:CheY-like chemotaxis protein
LLVEDNTEVADTLAEMLGLAGFRVEVAYDGPSALARATATAPEIIVCDLGLPAGMDGYAVARACRADPALRDTRLIAASGYSRPEDHAKAKAAGFDVLVGKPVGLKRLEEVLREILPKR